MVTTFDQVMDVVLGWEGGYTTNAADPGNWTGGRAGVGELRGTNFGVSAASYPDVDIRALTVEGAKEIYRRDYWSRVAGDSLPGPLALLTFDAAVNNGVGRAALWLQRVAGVNQDGKIGPGTIAAVTERVSRDGGGAVCGEYLALRMSFMAALPTWKVFGAGWARRLALLPYQSVLITSDGPHVP